MSAPTRPVPVTGAEPPRPESDAEALARLRRENAALKGQLLALASDALTIRSTPSRTARKRRFAGWLGQSILFSAGVSLGMAWAKLSAPATRTPSLPGVTSDALPAGSDTLAGHIVRQASELDALAREYEPGR
jgi:hypothetical protein